MMNMHKTLAQLPKRTLIYTAVAVLLILIFIFQETADTQKNTLTVPLLAGKINQLTLKQGDQTLQIKLNPAADTAKPTAQEAAPDQASKTDRWIVGQAGYPAETDRVTHLIEAFKEIDTAEIISSRGNYEKFGLSDADKRILRISTDADETAIIALGNDAAAGNAVYGRINGKPQVVLLPKGISTYFSLDLKVFRQKNMGGVAEADVKRIEIRSPQQPTLYITRRAEPEEPSTTETTAEKEDAGSTAASDTAGKSPATSEASQTSAQPAWQARYAQSAESAQAAEFKTSTFRALFAELDSLTADGFPTATPSGSILADIRISKMDGTKTEITLWLPTKDKHYPAKLSSNKYPFLMAEWRVRRLLLNQERYFK